MTTTGCRGPSSTVLGDQQHHQSPLLRGVVDPGSYDSTFDAVSGEGAETIALSDYLVWATTCDPRSADNATALEGWIGYFHRYVTNAFDGRVEWRWSADFSSFDANGDGKVDFGEMHRPAGEGGEGGREL